MSKPLHEAALIARGAAVREAAEANPDCFVPDGMGLAIADCPCGCGRPLAIVIFAFYDATKVPTTVKYALNDKGVEAFHENWTKFHAEWLAAMEGE